MSDAGVLSVNVLPDVPRLPDRSVSQLAFPHRETYAEMVRAFRDAGFETCADLCAVDYLTHPGRSLPDGVKPERFEVVVNLLSLSRRQRVRPTLSRIACSHAPTGIVSSR